MIDIDSNDVDLEAMLTPDRQTTAKKLRGKYRALDDHGVTVRCESCNATPATPETVVVAFPLPWTDDGTRSLLDASCWAAVAEKRTDLDEREAEIHALQWAGLSVPEISSATMLDEDEIEETLTELGAGDRSVL